MIYTQLRSFHAVATAGGFTAASRTLGVGQPTITSQVKALERYFNVELFHRQGRQVALTEVGRALFAVTRRIMNREEEAVGLLNAYGGFHIGHLRVGAVGPYDATEMLAAFNERFPDLKISVTMGNSREVLDALFDFSADVAVLAQIEDDPRLFAIPYSRHPVVVFVNTDHPWARRRRVRIAELQDQPMVLRGEGSTTRRVFEEAIGKAGVTINPVMEIGSREAVWMAVRHGLGIGVVSELEFYTDPNLRTLEISDADVHYYTHVVCLTGRRESHLVRALFEVVEALRRVRDGGGA